MGCQEAWRLRFSNTVTIGRSAHEVFGFVSELENVPRWNHAIVETRKTSDGPVGVGTEYRQIRSLPNRSEETLRVTELEPDRRLAVRGRLGPFAGTLVYEFEDLGGMTRLTNTAELEARGVMRVAAPLASRRVRDAVASNLRTLKDLLERGGA